MVYEILINEVAPERREAYIEAHKTVWRKVHRPGCQGVRYLSCIEKPGRVIIQIAWDSVQAHEDARKIPEHGTIRDVAAAFDAKGEGVAHYTIDDL
jgi:heme-degrading monooxygenase HmoA